MITRKSKMAAEIAEKSSFSHILTNIEASLNILNQLCIGFITLYISWLCLRTELTGIALHIWLATFGFTFLMAEGIMTHYNVNGLTNHIDRNGKTFLHIALQILGGGMGVAGCLIQLIHDDWSISATMHTRFGFAAFILCLISLLTGLCAFLSKFMIKMLPTPLISKTFHVLISFGTFLTAMLAQYYGYAQVDLFRQYGQDFLEMIQIVTLIVLILTCIAPLKTLYHTLCNLIN